ncbi:protein fantom-like isoform X3 [Mytilus trossulus]|uniref:protein fantom-like isoform X3 n=1 Tax=Mytilus trossulus TaxID=6551 RepID=UPI00300607A8
MGDVDMIPVRDPGGGRHDAGAEQQRRMVAKWDRDTLEDKYLRIYEENLILKKHARKQEDKIKKMATKLLRLVNDKKKDIDREHVGGKTSGMNIEVAEKMEEFKERIMKLEKQNHQLNEKLMLAKQQLSAASKRPSHYTHVGSRINTGIAKTQHAPPEDTRIAKNRRVIGPYETAPHRKTVSSPTFQKYGHNQLDNLRLDNRQKDDIIAQLQEQNEICEQELEEFKQRMKLQEAGYEEDLVKIKQQITAEHRFTVQENIDMIKVQREVKEKSTRLMELNEKYALLESNMSTVKHGHDSMLMEMERLNMQLKEEQNRVLTLQNELKFGTANNRKLIELQEQTSCLEKENQILKEANEKFVNSAFDLEREREWRQRENALKVQIAQLEATLKADLGEKGGILDKLARESDQFEKLQQDYRSMQVEHYQLKEEYDDLKEKMRFFTKESAIDFSEIEEALVLVKQKKQKAIPDPDFLQKVDVEVSKDEHKQLLEIQAEYAETVHELEKTRNLLVIQHKINKDYQHEVEISSTKIDEIKKEYETKLDEYARLLDIRAARIKKLESQMRDVAYGTKQFKITAPTDELEEPTLDFDETIHLERGQNLFEIHIQKISLSDDGLKILGDDEPLLFCTWEFFEYEIQSTPVLRGARPEFDFTSQYIVKVDDFFLHYLQKESCTMELHQSFGQDYKTVAACQMVFKDIFDKPHGRIHGTATLIGVDSTGSGISLGMVEYWIRLRVPMEQALRLYKERTKALGYITTNKRAAEIAIEATDEVAMKRQQIDNINQMHIKIIRCNGLQSRRKGVQPSPYCVYQFYDNNDHDTPIIHASNNPEFNDHKTYPVAMTSDLDQYMKTKQLTIFVFDDTDPEQASYLGFAEIPLLPLCHNKGVKGVFELKGPRGTVNGTMEVDVRFQEAYLLPKGGLPQKEEPIATVKVVDTPLDETLRPPSTPKERSKIAARFPPPSHTSTPMTGQEDHHEGVAALSDMMATPITPAAKPRKKVSRRLEDSAEQPTVNAAVADAVSSMLPSMSDTIQSETLPAPDDSPRPSTRSGSRRTSEEQVEEVYTPRSSKSGTPRSKKSTSPPHTPVHVSEPHTPERVSEPRTPESGEKTTSTSKGDNLPDEGKGTLTSMEGTKMSDTMFADPDEDEITEEISEDITPIATPSDGGTLRSLPPPIEEESESDRPPVESDSEGVMVVASPTAKKKYKESNKPSNLVTVTITHLVLSTGASVLDNESIRQLFVSYNFLGIKADELETPFSLPKPKAEQQINFNFSKTFHVDMAKNYPKRQYLAGMLLPDDPDGGRIRFTVVSEPPDDDDEGECEDIGIAFVSVRDILINHKDVIDHDIPIFDANNEKEEIGSLNVTVQCLSALDAVEKEMQIDGTF